jgi:hypothetical protein
MRKLELNLDSLQVDSFHASLDEGSAAYARYHSELIYTVLGPTEALSCGGTCGTCGGTDCWA